MKPSAAATINSNPVIVIGDDPKPSSDPFAAEKLRNFLILPGPLFEDATLRKRLSALTSPPDVPPCAEEPTLVDPSPCIPPVREGPSHYAPPLGTAIASVAPTVLRYVGLVPPSSHPPFYDQHCYTCGHVFLRVSWLSSYQFLPETLLYIRI